MANEALTRGGRSILVVEDHADTVRALTRLLEMDGHAVTAARTSGEAMAAIAGGGGARYDVLVADVGLPDGDGCEVVRAFRAARPGAAAIVLTAFGMAEDVRRARGAGADRVLIKPCGTIELPAAIAALTARDQVGA